MNTTIKNIRAFIHKPSTPVCISKEQAKTLSKSLFVDLKKVDFKELWQGMNIELEHVGTLKEFGVQDLHKAAARIALDHLAEDKHYYTKLKKVEGK